MEPSQCHHSGIVEACTSDVRIRAALPCACLLALEGDWRRAEATELTRLFKAIVCALDLTTCEHLLRGEGVPKSQLDDSWVRKLGRRR